MPKRTSTSRSKNSEKNKPKRTTAAKPKKPTVKKTTRSSPKPKTSTKADKVTLPSNMSQRSITKSLTYKAYFSGYGAHVALTIGALCILAGGSLALFASFNTNINLQLAQVCLTGTCVPTTTSSNQTIIDDTTDPTFNTTTAPAPSLSLQDPLPGTISTTLQLKLVVNDVTAITAELEEADGARLIVPSDFISNGLYYITIPGDTLPPGTYNLAVVADVIDSSRFTRTLGTFVVPAPPSASTTASSSDTTTVQATEPITTMRPAPTEPNLLAPEATTTNQRMSDGPVLISTDSTASNGLDATAPEQTLVISTPNTTLSGRIVLPITAPLDLPFIEVYVRRDSTVTPLFVGLADKSFGYWRFPFDTTLLPNATYSLFAKTSDTALANNISNTLYVTVSNQTLTRPVSTAPPSALEQEPTVDTVAEQLSERDAEQPQIIPESSTTTETKALFSRYETDIATALRQYSVAVRDKDPSLVGLAENQLTAIQDEMVSDIEENADAALAATEIADQFAKLQQHTDTVEALRAQRATKPVVDTDRDGINDADETTLYGTDPNAADTDKDGFADGIEIVRGYDPLNANSEAAVVYELPTESVGTEREDILVIESVVPQIRALGVEEMTMTESVIKGTALPNSFVTLYIFSTPIIVTVRTDDDGGFEFTLSRELADGSHDVYAAITDNTGMIVAKSQPFSFIKEANAYTPLQSDATAGTATPAAITFITTRAYATTFGLAILTFGVLLFFLGSGLRKRTDPAPTAAT